MSIIYEALKKVEANANDKAIKASRLLSDINNSANQPPKKINLAFYVLVAICTISTILIAVGAYFSNRDMQLQTVNHARGLNGSLAGSAYSGLKSSSAFSNGVKSFLGKKEIAKTGKEVLRVDKEYTWPMQAESPLPALARPDSPVYSLQGIVYDNGSPFCLINGKTLKESDTINDFTVIKITPSVVKLQNLKDNKELTLSF